MLLVSEPKTIIIGSGLLGLALGRLLPGSVVCEKSPFTGGLCRTIHHKGFHFDIGFHVIVSLDPEVRDFLAPVVGDRIKAIPYSKQNFSTMKNGRVGREIRDLLWIRVGRFLLRPKQMPKKTPQGFSYPLPWFGILAEKLAEGLEVRCSSEISRIYFHGKRVTEIEINRGEKLPCSRLVLAIPPYTLIDLFDPPETVRQRAGAIRYRSLIYAVFFFAIDHVFDEFALYAGRPEIFGRVSEPKNLGQHMAPPGMTSLCFEINCFSTDPIWHAPDSQILQKILQDFRPYHPVPDPVETVIYRIPRVQALRDSSFKSNVKTVYEFISSFENVFCPRYDLSICNMEINSTLKEALRLTKEIPPASG